MQTRDLDRIRFVTRHFHDLQGLRYWVPLGLITLSVGGTTYFANKLWVLLGATLFLGGLLLAFGARRYYRRTFGEVEQQPVYPVADLSSLSVFSPAGTILRLRGSQRMPLAHQRFFRTTGLFFAFFVTMQAISPPVIVAIDESLLNSILFFEPVPLLMSDSSTALQAVFGQMMYALYGAFFLSVWLWRGRRLSQSYHLALGVLLLGLSSLGICLGFLAQANWETVEVLYPFIPAVVHLWLAALLLCGSSMILAGLLDHWQLVRALGRRVED